MLPTITARQIQRDFQSFLTLLRNYKRISLIYKGEKIAEITSSFEKARKQNLKKALKQLIGKKELPASLNYKKTYHKLLEKKYS